MEFDAALRRRIKHCLDCGIRFLAAPQNAGRNDLRCPFGCAKRHRARQSNERVKAYRGTAAGKAKKEALNARRYRRQPSIPCPLPHETSARASRSHEPSPRTCSRHAENATLPCPSEPSVPLELDLDGVVLDESSIIDSPMLPYIRTLIWILDGIRLNHVEVVQWLRRVLRQRSMVYRSRRDYVLRFLHQHPP